MEVNEVEIVSVELEEEGAIEVAEVKVVALVETSL